MPDRATDATEAPSLRSHRGAELHLSGPALVELMRAVLAKGASFRFCAKGWSMAPFIRDGDVITVAPPRDSNGAPSAHPASVPVPTRSCFTGQVVAFISPASGRLVVHRIVGRRGSSFLVQGDSVRGAGIDVVGREDMLGRVVGIKRGGRSVWLGLGPERYAIAALSRAGLLLPVVVRAGVIARFLRG